MSIRYIRLIDLLGNEGFKRLQNTRILLVGVGAIGAEIAKNLTMLGVQELILVDRDYIEMPNLALSFLYSREDAEKKRKKANVAAEKLRKINSDVEITSIPKPVENIPTELFENADITVLALDNDATRLHVNSLFLEKEFDTYLIDCGASGLRAEITTVKPPDTACLRCVSPLREVARHPCLPSHLFEPQEFVDYVEIAKINFYEKKNEILDPNNPEHVSWILEEIQKEKEAEGKGNKEKMKNEIQEILKNPIRIYPSIFIRTAAIATKKALTLAKLSEREIKEGKRIFTQVKILGMEVSEEPVEKRKNCPQCGTGEIALVVDKHTTLQGFVHKLKEEYGLLNPRIWKKNGAILFDSPKKASPVERKWIKRKLPKKIKELGLSDGSTVMLRSNIIKGGNKNLKCHIKIKNEKE